MRRAPREATDVVLFDTFGRADLGLAAIPNLLAHPHVDTVLIYSWDSDRALVDRALTAGAAGFVSKTLAAEALVEAIEDVAAGRQIVKTRAHPRSWYSTLDWPGRAAGLTEREAEVLSMLIRGMRNSEIAEALFISVDTTKTHLKAVYRKLGVRNRVEAGAYAHKDSAFALHDKGATL